MKDFKKLTTEIWAQDKKTVILMALTVLFAIILLIFSFARLDLSGSLIKTGYSDITGYKQGKWSEMLVFALIAILFGVLHNFLALKIFQKYGVGMARIFLSLTLFLIFGAFLVLTRLSSGV